MITTLALAVSLGLPFLFAMILPNPRRRPVEDIAKEMSSRLDVGLTKLILMGHWQTGGDLVVEHPTGAVQAVFLGSPQWALMAVLMRYAIAQRADYPDSAFMPRRIILAQLEHETGQRYVNSNQLNTLVFRLRKDLRTSTRGWEDPAMRIAQEAWMEKLITTKNGTGYRLQISKYLLALQIDRNDEMEIAAAPAH